MPEVTNKTAVFSFPAMNGGLWLACRGLNISYAKSTTKNVPVGCNKMHKPQVYSCGPGIRSVRFGSRLSFYSTTSVEYKSL